MGFAFWNLLQKSNTRPIFFVVVGFFKWFLLHLAFALHFLCQARIFFCFPYASFCRRLPHSVCMYIFLEGLHDLIELSHPRGREFRVSHLSINKGENEVTQQLHSPCSSCAGCIGDGVRETAGLSRLNLLLKKNIINYIILS